MLLCFNIVVVHKATSPRLLQPPQFGVLPEDEHEKSPSQLRKTVNRPSTPWFPAQNGELHVQQLVRCYKDKFFFLKRARPPGRSLALVVLFSLKFPSAYQREGSYLVGFQFGGLKKNISIELTYQAYRS